VPRISWLAGRSIWVRRTPPPQCGGFGSLLQVWALRGVTGCRLGGRLAGHQVRGSVRRYRRHAHFRSSMATAPDVGASPRRHREDAPQIRKAPIDAGSRRVFPRLGNLPRLGKGVGPGTCGSWSRPRIRRDLERRRYRARPCTHAAGSAVEKRACGVVSGLGRKGLLNTSAMADS